MSSPGGFGWTARPQFREAFGELAQLLTVRPMGLWPGPPAANRKRAPFRASWGNTVRLLALELRAVRARTAVLQLAIEADGLRRDGLPYAGITPRQPGVILTFELPNVGALAYPCDRFDDWQDNVRAIALGLEALRAVDRYGITRRSEQYRGWAALPASTETPLTRDEAARIIATEAAIAGFDARALLGNVDIQTAAIREALKKTHPDRGGSADAFHRVQRARRTLEGAAR